MPKAHTHASIFHADEVIAAGLLIHLKAVAGVEDVIRANTVPESLERGDFVVDIGGKLGVDESGVIRLDHHQDRELPCAAALVYRHFESRWSAAEKRAAERFLDGVDRHDRGVAVHQKGTLTLSGIIDAMNPVGEADEATRTAHFREAVALFLDLFRRLVGYQELVESHSEAVAAFVAKNAPFVVSEAHLPKLLRSLEGTLTRFAAYPSLRGGWSLQAVCVPGTKTPVQSIPADTPGATFVHAAGFIAAFATKEDAVTAATELVKTEIFTPVKSAPEEVVIPLPGAARSTAGNPFGL